MNFVMNFVKMKLIYYSFTPESFFQPPSHLLFTICGKAKSHVNSKNH